MNHVSNIINNRNRLPRFKNYKIYPTAECDICFNIDIVETCPLENCNTNLCPSCWNKIITEFNRKCPTCRRRLPFKQPTCCEKMEEIIAKNICPNHIRIIIVPFISILILLSILAIFTWIFSGFVNEFWYRFFVFMLIISIVMIVLILILYCLDFLNNCWPFIFCNPLEQIRRTYNNFFAQPELPLPT